MACASQAGRSGEQQELVVHGWELLAHPVWNGGFGASGRPGVARLPALARRRRLAVDEARQPAAASRRRSSGSAACCARPVSRGTDSPRRSSSARLRQRSRKPAGQVKASSSAGWWSTSVWRAATRAIARPWPPGSWCRPPARGARRRTRPASRVTVRSLGTDRPASMWGRRHPRHADAVAGEPGSGPGRLSSWPPGGRTLRDYAKWLSRRPRPPPVEQRGWIICARSSPASPARTAPTWPSCCSTRATRWWAWCGAARR